MEKVISASLSLFALVYLYSASAAPCTRSRPSNATASTINTTRDWAKFLSQALVQDGKFFSTTEETKPWFQVQVGTCGVRGLRLHSRFSTHGGVIEIREHNVLVPTITVHVTTVVWVNVISVSLSLFFVSVSFKGCERNKFRMML